MLATMAEQVAAGILDQAVLDEFMIGSRPDPEPVPDFYPFIRAARYLGVPPWDLAGIPETRGCQVWMHWALAAERGENEAQAELHKRADRKRR